MVRTRGALAVLCALVMMATVAPAAAAQVPDAEPAGHADGRGRVRCAEDAGATGYDTYRRLDLLPCLPDEVDTRQFSGTDHLGLNNDGFSGTYSCLGRVDVTDADRARPCLIAEDTGAGEIDSIWFTRDEGNVSATGDITIELDGQVVVQSDLQGLVNGDLGTPFVFPLVANADQSSGGVYIKVPMSYRESMRVTTESNPFFVHVTYRQFDSAEGITTFDPGSSAEDVVALLAASGTADPKPAAHRPRIAESTFDLAPGQSRVLARFNGHGTIDQLRLRLPQVVGLPPQDIRDGGRAFGLRQAAGSGASEFTVAIDPSNTGVRLIRRLDCLIGNQRAAVLVDGQPTGLEWAPLPACGGGWLDQVIDLPPALTAGKSSIRIRNDYISSDLDFNEFRYTVQSLVGGAYVQTDLLDTGPLSEELASQAAHDYRIEGQNWEGVKTFQYADRQVDPELEARIAASDEVLREARLRITFDGQTTVDSPVGEFFGSGLGEAEVTSLFSAMQTAEDGSYYSWWPMPFARSARVELVNESDQTITGGDATVTAGRDNWGQALRRGEAGYFHATSHRAETVPDQDWIFLDVAGQGKFVGVHHTAEALTPGVGGPFAGRRGYLEGDERVYVDGSRTPQLYGTGSEDFYESGWYFNRGVFSNPFNGNTVHEVEDAGCAQECDAVYRLMIGDAVPFASGLRFGMEHGPHNDVPATYGSTAFWYGQGEVTLRSTDVLDVGDPASEAAHDYTGGGDVQSLTSVFEGDYDTVAVTDQGRASGERISFTLDLERRNDGVVLRRRSDQEAAFQTAAVLVDGQPAGTWRQPLNNTSQRWLDDTFPLPESLTGGKRRITVELVPADGAPAWHAARYEALNRVRPFTDRTAPGQVTGLVATGSSENRIQLTWNEAGDDVGVDRYEVYGSATDPTVPIDQQNLLGETRVPGFTHTDGLNTTWYYRVRAVDRAGNTGQPSEVASATTGDTLRIEAEDLLPPEQATAPAVNQSNCCGIAWSAGAQVWFQAASAPQTVTLAVDLPQAGSYQLAAIYTEAIDYGITTLAIDGQQVGQPFDGYDPVLRTTTVTYDPIELAAGQHTLTVTVTGRNPAATGFFAGLDRFDFQLR